MGELPQLAELRGSDEKIRRCEFENEEGDGEFVRIAA